MNTVLDLIYRLLAHPTDAMSDVTTGEKMKESSIIWGFVVLLLALSSVEAGSFVTAFLASFVGTGSLLLIHSAVVDYISGLLGGRGTARGITAGFMCALIPYAFSVFFSLIGQFGLDGIHKFAVFAIAVWSFFLDILAIRANYGFGKGKAFFISISPFLLCGMLITALFVIGIMTALAGISELQDVEGIINSF